MKSSTCIIQTLVLVSKIKLMLIYLYLLERKHENPFLRISNLRNRRLSSWGFTLTSWVPSPKQLHEVASPSRRYHIAWQFSRRRLATANEFCVFHVFVTTSFFSFSTILILFFVSNASGQRSTWMSQHHTDTERKVRMRKPINSDDLA